MKVQATERRSVQPSTAQTRPALLYQTRALLERASPLPKRIHTSPDGTQLSQVELCRRSCCRMKPTLVRCLPQCGVGRYINIPLRRCDQGGVPDARRSSRPPHWSQPPLDRDLLELVCVSSSDDRAPPPDLGGYGGKAKVWGKFGGRARVRCAADGRGRGEGDPPCVRVRVAATLAGGGGEGLGGMCACSVGGAGLSGKQARRQARCFRRVAFRWRCAGGRVARARGFRQLYARPGRARAAA